MVLTGAIPSQSQEGQSVGSPEAFERRVIGEEELKRMLKESRPSFFERNKACAVTLVLLALNIVVFVVELLLSGLGVALSGGVSSKVLFDMGAMYVPAIQGPADFYRFITPMFLHMSPMHLAFNMVALYSVGELLERRLGHGNFLALYFIGGITGNVLTFAYESFLMGNQSVQSLAVQNPFSISAGASTSVFGLFVAVALIGFLSKQKDARLTQFSKSMLSVIGVNVAVTLLVPGISITGHLGGAVGGLIGMFMIPAKSLRVPAVLRVAATVLWVLLVGGAIGYFWLGNPSIFFAAGQH